VGKIQQPRLGADIPNAKQNHQFSHPRLNVGQASYPSYLRQEGKFCAANMFFTENII